MLCIHSYVPHIEVERIEQGDIVLRLVKCKHCGKVKEEH